MAEIAVLHAATNQPISRSTEKTVADPDPQMGGGGGGGGGGRGGHPDPEIRGRRGQCQKNLLRPFGPQYGLKIRWGPGPSGPLPWNRH